MINEVIIERLDELIGDYDTPFFNYLIYSYDLSLSDFEEIIDELKRDIRDNKVQTENIVATLHDYLNAKVVDLEKREKVEYMNLLTRKDNDFYLKYLEKYNLDDDEIDMVRERVKSKIEEENITDFEIKRHLEYYFENTVKQSGYLRDIDWIKGRNYDTLIIRQQMRMYPILLFRDISQILLEIRMAVIDAKDFPKGIKHAFKRECMLKSEAKKVEARQRLNILVEGKGDSFGKLIEFKGLTKRDGSIIVKGIEDDILNGRIQPEKVNNNLLIDRFNEYIENEGK